MASGGGLVPCFVQGSVTVSVPAVMLRSEERCRARASCYERKPLLRDENGHGDENRQHEQQYGAPDAAAPRSKFPRVVWTRHP
jgi:hypothetical protein